MKNVVLENIGKLSDVTDKLFEKEKLGLTGMEISINNLVANEGNPFVHTHQQNEELYIVIKGSGVLPHQGGAGGGACHCGRWPGHDLHLHSDGKGQFEAVHYDRRQAQ